MKFSKYFIPTMLNNPADTESISQRLMLRTGMIKKVSNGLFVYLPNYMRVMSKVVRVIKEEMQSVDCNQVKFPILVAREFLEDSGRWNAYGKEMFKLKDRNGKDFAISPTNEEAACLMASQYVISYKDLPFSLYQIQQKHRDEIRPRGGVKRAREFIMKDAYSFHATSQCLDEYYQKMHDAYFRIFHRIGLKSIVAVKADSGAIGGDNSEEIMAVCPTGDAEIAVCQGCQYSANLEIISCPRPEKIPFTESKLGVEKVATPNISTIEDLSNFLQIDSKKIVKSMIFKADKEFVMALVRGDREVNDVKLNKILKAQSIELATEEEIAKNCKTAVGFVGPTIEKMRIFADYEIENMQNFIVGANEKDFHLKNVNITDFKCEFIDLRNAVEGDVCPKCGKPITITHGDELGHIFQIGTRYTEPLSITFTNSDGKSELMTMGCYGIGIERVISAIIEEYADESGIAWPVQVAPFEVNIITVDMKNPEQKNLSESIYKNLVKNGYDVIWDDRQERAGFKFKDSELIGFPVNIIVGKNAVNNQVEIQKRLGEKVIINSNEIEDILKEYLSK